MKMSDSAIKNDVYMGYTSEQRLKMMDDILSIRRDLDLMLFRFTSEMHITLKKFNETEFDSPVIPEKDFQVLETLHLIAEVFLDNKPHMVPGAMMIQN